MTSACPHCGRELKCVGASTSGAIFFETCPNPTCEGKYSQSMKANDLAYNKKVETCNHVWERAFYSMHCKKCGTWK